MEPNPLSTAAAAWGADSKVNILLVDDNPESVLSMTAALESLEENLLTATSGQEALKHLLKRDVAVMVLDVMMPEMDGFELASVIRSRDRFKQTPIIFLTGIGSEDRNVLQGYQSGAVDYLLKPCDPQVLRYKVKVFVELAKKTALLQDYAKALQNSTHSLQEALSSTLRAKAALEGEIAERKRVEAMRDSLAGKLAASPDFVETMAEGAVTLSAEGSILYCNRRFAEMLGCEPADLHSVSFRSKIAPGSSDSFDALLSGSLQARVNGEIQLRSEAGIDVPVQIGLNRFRESGGDALAMVVTDLRDQKRNEELLRDGKLARLILEHAMTGITVCDGLGRVILASKALQQICGSNPLLRRFDEVLPLTVADDSGRQFSIAETIAGKHHTSTEVLLRRPDGSAVPLVLSAAPLVSETGSTIGGLAVLLDISERKLMEQALRRSERAAVAGRLAGTLAHEVNNPLAAVTNILFILQSLEAVPDEMKTYLDVASSELARISHIVKTTLAFYRDSEKPVPVRLTELLDSVVDLFEAQIRQKRIAVRKQYRFTGQVDAYPVEVRQAVSNLVANAIYALPEEGSIKIRVSAGRDRRNARDGIRIVVADNGPGIPPECRGKLFEPFFTTKGEKGTGLGLWVTESIVQKHRGTIRLRTRQGHGTLFCIFLPLDAAGGPREPANEALAAAGKSSAADAA
jgi:PAS domain S-box-containing protein